MTDHEDEKVYLTNSIYPRYREEIEVTRQHIMQLFIIDFLWCKTIIIISSIIINLNDNFYYVLHFRSMIIYKFYSFD